MLMEAVGPRGCARQPLLSEAVHTFPGGPRDFEEAAQGEAGDLRGALLGVEGGRGAERRMVRIWPRVWLLQPLTDWHLQQHVARPQIPVHCTNTHPELSAGISCH